MDKTAFHNLVSQVTSFPRENEWVEWKHNKADEEEIGKNISGLSNSAALLGKLRAYIFWGREDGSDRLLGTQFRPRETKIGNQELESWLVIHLHSQVDLSIHEGEIDGKWIVIFEITPAMNQPVRFKGTEYIRIGSYTKKLHEFPEKERELWRVFDRTTFERHVALSCVSSDQVVALIDCNAYFDLMQMPMPENRIGILERLESEKLIVHTTRGDYDITNLGAVLFAKNLDNFEYLSRKCLRIILYRTNDRTEAFKEYKMSKGYAAGFKDIISYINNQLPQNEQILQGFRKETRMYPEIAIRELVANALIHQDFAVRGMGPTIEIFVNRIEITNPGTPLIDTLRFIDETPRSRNEMIAAMMRRCNICEERGSGIDKVISNVEIFQLPAPDFRKKDQSTIVILYGPRGFKEMDSAERKRACYHHACLQYVWDKKMTNESLRNRLGINPKSYPLASRIIRDTIEAKLIRPRGDEIGFGKSASYLPFWA